MAAPPAGMRCKARKKKGPGNPLLGQPLKGTMGIACLPSRTLSSLSFSRSFPLPRMNLDTLTRKHQPGGPPLQPAALSAPFPPSRDPHRPHPAAHPPDPPGTACTLLSCCWEMQVHKPSSEGTSCAHLDISRLCCTPSLWLPCLILLRNFTRAVGCVLRFPFFPSFL